MRLWPVLFVAVLPLAVYSGLLRAENDPPAWAVGVYVATVLLAGVAEVLRRRDRSSGTSRTP